MSTALKIAQIRVDGGTQTRANVSEKVVARFGRAMKRGDEFPPVHVFFDGEQHWMADGFHRIKARKEGGHEDIQAVVERGTARDAFLYALATTGSRNLSLAERKVCAWRLLRDPEWSEWSDRTIGRQCGIDHKTVGKLRKLSGENAKMQPTRETPGGIPEAEVIPIDHARAARKRKALRNGKEYEVSLPDGTPRRKHLSLKAKAVIKHLPIVKDRKQMDALAALESPTQMLVAQRLKAGESATVEQAMKAILSGAPVDVWSRAYAAMLKLQEDDRLRMFRFIVKKGDLVKACTTLLAETEAA